MAKNGSRSGGWIDPVGRRSHACNPSTGRWTKPDTVTKDTKTDGTPSTSVHKEKGEDRAQ